MQVLGQKLENAIEPKNVDADIFKVVQYFVRSNTFKFTIKTIDRCRHQKHL